MNNLIPLEQFYCDQCGEVISFPDEGRVEWLTKQVMSGWQYSGFKIVHKSLSSPLNSVRINACHHYPNQFGGSAGLDTFLGQQGIKKLLRYLDMGRFHEPDYRGPHVNNVREFVELFRRLHVPFYEEARKFWTQARYDGWCEKKDEIEIYDEKNLKAMIKKYSHRHTMVAA